jgi:hypothetical protein
MCTVFGGVRRREGELGREGGTLLLKLVKSFPDSGWPVALLCVRICSCLVLLWRNLRYEVVGAEVPTHVVEGIELGGDLGDGLARVSGLFRCLGLPIGRRTVPMIDMSSSTRKLMSVRLPRTTASLKPVRYWRSLSGTAAT